MRKLKLALVLPAFQLLISAFLIKWGETVSLRLGLLNSPLGNLKDLWEDLNAPGLLFRYIELLLSPAKWIPHRFLGVQTDTVLFLLGVAVLWYCVGRKFDGPIFQHSRFQLKIPARKLLFSLFLLLWGVRLGLFAIEFISSSDSQNHHRPSDITNGSIFVIWSLILVIVGAREFGTSVRARPTSSISGAGLAS